MKKSLFLTLALALTLVFVGCGAKDDPAVKSEGVMTYQEYAAAAIDDSVVIEAYVQAHQDWWDGKVTVYAQDTEGAYYLYELPCTEEDSKKLVPGTKLKVTGKKAEWSGEVEVVDSTFEILEGSYIAQPTDVTALLGKDELINHMNKRVSFKGMTVESIGKDDNGNDAAFFYREGNSGQEGDDLYFKVSVNGQSYIFCVESYLCGKDTEVYKAVKNLKIGDKIDLEGFLYWYNGPNPHITSVTAAK